MQVTALPAACIYLIIYLTACGGDTLAASLVVLGSTIAVDIIAIIINFCYIFYYLLLRITIVTAIIIIIVVIFCLLRAGEILRFSFSMPYNSSVNAPSRWVLEGTNDRPGHCRILQRRCFCHGQLCFAGSQGAAVHPRWRTGLSGHGRWHLCTKAQRMPVRCSLVFCTAFHAGMVRLSTAALCTGTRQERGFKN